MSAPSYNNPAGRLYHLIEGIKRKGHKTKLKEAWADVLGVDSDDLGALLPEYGYVLGLPNEVRQQMDAVDPESAYLYAGDISKIERFMSAYYLGHSVEQFNSAMGEGVMKTLAFCDRDLSRSMPSDAEVRSTHADLENKLSELRADVAESDLPEDAINRITAYADLISQALADYEVRGIEGAASVAQGVAISIHKDVHGGRLKAVWLQVKRLSQIAAFVALGSDVLGAVVDVNTLYPGSFPFLPEHTQTEEAVVVEEAEVVSDSVAVPLSTPRQRTPERGSSRLP